MSRQAGESPSAAVVVPPPPTLLHPRPATPIIISTRHSASGAELPVAYVQASSERPHHFPSSGQVLAARGCHRRGLRLRLRFLDTFDDPGRFSGRSRQAVDRYSWHFGHRLGKIAIIRWRPRALAEGLTLGSGGSSPRQPHPHSVVSLVSVHQASGTGRLEVQVASVRWQPGWTSSTSQGL